VQGGAHAQEDSVARQASDQPTAQPGAQAGRHDHGKQGIRSNRDKTDEDERGQHAGERVPDVQAAGNDLVGYQVPGAEDRRGRREISDTEGVEEGRDEAGG
jgi:hypothetical protein